MKNEKTTWPQRFATVLIGCAINQSFWSSFLGAKFFERSANHSPAFNDQGQKTSQVVHLFNVRHAWRYA